MIKKIKNIFLRNQLTCEGKKRGEYLLPASQLINLGCGLTFHNAWDNFDLIPVDKEVRYLDLLKRLPFAESSYSYCYSSHVLEHMPRPHAPGFLKEIHRILRPDGVIRIVVPDLEGIVRNYLSELENALHGDPSAVSRHEWMSIELLDQLTRFASGGIMGRLWYSRPLPSRALIEKRLGAEASKWMNKFDQDFKNGVAPMDPEKIYDMATPSFEEEVEFRKTGEIHRWMYDRVSLKALLEKAGFRDVKVCKSTTSLIPDFADYHLDTDEDGGVRKPDSLFMEGVK